MLGSQLAQGDNVCWICMVPPHMVQEAKCRSSWCVRDVTQSQLVHNPGPGGQMVV